MKTFEKIKNELEKNIKGKEIKIDSNFRDLGIDSIELLDFVVKIEEEMNITISDEELLKLETIKDIVEIIDSKK